MALAIGVIGWGNSARALTFYLSKKGYNVLVYVRDTKKYPNFENSPFLSACGVMNGQIRFCGITSNIEKFLDHSSVIFVATDTRAYADIAEKLDPFLEIKKHKIILFSAKLLGCFAFLSALKKTNASSLQIMETDAIFAARIKEDGSIWIRGMKRWTLFGSDRSSKALKGEALIKEFFPGLQMAEHLIQRGLTDFGALAHPIISLVNISKIDRAEEFYFYYEGLSKNTFCLLEAAEKEFQLLAKAYHSTLIPMKDLLDRYYGCQTDDLYVAMRTVPNYRDSLAPKLIHHRYLQEDVSCTLVPMLELAELAGIKLPTIHGVVQIFSVLAQKDFFKEGRRLSALGFASFSAADIISYLES